MTTKELRVFCEGATERTFVSNVLHPHLKAFQVYAHPVMRIDKGKETGVSSWPLIRKDLMKDVGRARSHQYFTTMFDLYRFHCPRFDIPDGLTSYEKVLEIERQMKADLDNPRFIPYLQLHEFEALCFVDLGEIPKSFPDRFQAVERSIGQLKASVSQLQPEEIDEGPTTAPSKRIIAAVPEYRRLKPVVGPQIVGRIGLHVLREKCPHFGEWLSQLEKIGESS